MLLSHLLILVHKEYLEEAFMTYDIEKREAIEVGFKTLDRLHAAKNNLNSAKNWGLVDMFGGGFLSTML